MSYRNIKITVTLYTMHTIIMFSTHFAEGAAALGKHPVSRLSEEEGD